MDHHEEIRRLNNNVKEDNVVLNIYQRINAVMKSVKYLKKDTQVGHGNAGYKAVSYDNVVGSCREAMVAEGIVCYPEQDSPCFEIKRDVDNGVKMHLFTSNFKIHLVNIDNPEDRMFVAVTAHASDNGDKSSAKAITQATKSAILKVFFLESGEQEDSIYAEKELISKDQVIEIKDEIGGDKDLEGRLFASLCVSSVEEIYLENFNQTMKNLKRVKSGSSK